MYRCILIVLLLSSQVLAANSQTPSQPTISNGEPGSASGLLPPVQQPPMPPPGPQPLLQGQCVMGAESSEPSGTTRMYAGPEKLYIDVNRPAKCGGVVVRWEVCFAVEGTSPVLGNVHLRLVVFRPENGGSYEVGPQTTLDLDPGVNIEAASATCRYIDAAEDAITVNVREGDVVGFISSSRIRVALSASERSTLYEHRPMPTGQQGSVANALGSEDVLQRDLQLVGPSVAPLLRVVINMTIVPSTTLVPSSTKTPHSPPCPTDSSNNGGSRPIFNDVFMSVVIVAALFVFALFVVVIVLICCFCGCCGKCDCLNCSRSRRKRKKESEQRRPATAVEPVSDQSMMYNQIYVSSNPHYIIVNGKRYVADMQDNPAYGSHNAEEQNSESRSQSQRNSSAFVRGLDHTYESVSHIR